MAHCLPCLQMHGWPFKASQAGNGGCVLHDQPTALALAVPLQIGHPAWQGC